MVNFNGDLLPDTAHFINASNRGIRYGDALSESARFTGGRLQLAEAHYFNLMASMRQLRMEIPMHFTQEFLEDEIRKTVLAAPTTLPAAAVRITVIRSGGRDLQPASSAVDWIIEVGPLLSEAYAVPKGSCRADLFKDYYLSGDSLSGLGHSGRILHVLAGIYAAENDFDTCFILNHRKEVAEALDGPVFVRFGKVLRTPPLESGCQNSVLRKLLLRWGTKDEVFPIESGIVSPFELQQADEIFRADTIRGLLPVTAYRKATYTAEAAAYWTDRLNSGVAAIEG